MGTGSQFGGVGSRLAGAYSCQSCVALAGEKSASKPLDRLGALSWSKRLAADREIWVVVQFDRFVGCALARNVARQARHLRGNPKLYHYRDLKSYQFSHGLRHGVRPAFCIVENGVSHFAAEPLQFAGVTKSFIPPAVS
jgi:hypothetical protein